MKSVFKKVLGLSAVFLTAVILLILACTAYVRLIHRTLIVQPAQTPQSQAIMILGASIKSNGQPSDALRDRLETGIGLYKSGKAPLILLTGDDGRNRADEITVMKNYILKAGVPESAIFTDGQGYRTYESCARANKPFNIKQAIIVTQKFHLPRALYLCHRLGVDSVGVSADLHAYKDIHWFTVRDWLASFKAWLDINIKTPQPPVI